MNSSCFPAHIRQSKDGGIQYQSVNQHCRNTAAYAAAALHSVNLEESARLAGLLHDAGKCRSLFGSYLSDAVLRGMNGKTVNHSFCGVRFLLEHYHREDSPEYSQYTAELLAFAAGAHHGQFDCLSPDGKNGFTHRTTAPGIDYKETMDNYFAHCVPLEELDLLFSKSSNEIQDKFERIMTLSQQEDDELWSGECCFYLSLLARLLLSAVIEGDRRDTAEFMNCVSLPALPPDRQRMWKDCLARVEQLLSQFSSNTPIEQARQQISDQCRAFAQHPGGVYRLNVPTGGGKTLSSLRYALAHAAKWNKSRLIFTSPLLSILDQNARVIREFVGDDGLILEHHSNVIRSSHEDDRMDNRELLAENWAAPIIITTQVQLLNTLFSGKTSCIRRMQALCDSVIVLDEVQTVPNRMLTLFNLAVTFLSEVCGATVILCSATQPSLEKVTHPLLGSPKDMIPPSKELWEVFRRTSLVNAGDYRLEEIPDFALEVLENHESLLIVCNKKSEATELFHRLDGCGANCFHLSASMCMAHRRDTLEQIQASLARHEKTICVSTQVIEAGVDISFASAIRLLAGMDSAVQTAGRCNRHGEISGVSTVYLIHCVNEPLERLPDIKASRDASLNLFEAFQKNAAAFGGDLSSDAAIRFYYSRLYGEMQKGSQDYPVKKESFTLYSLLSDHKDAAGKYGERANICLNQAFKTAGTLFEVFDSDTFDVIVPYGRGADIIREFGSEAVRYDLAYQRKLLQAAKPYTISLFCSQQQNAQLQRELSTVCDGRVLVLLPEYYDNFTGFDPKRSDSGYLEV